MKFWLKATFPGSTASSPIAIVIVPALPAVTLSVHIFAPLDDNVFAVPFVMLMSVSKKSVMSMSEATVKSTSSPARMFVSVVDKVRVAWDCWRVEVPPIQVTSSQMKYYQLACALHVKSHRQPLWFDV